MEGAVGQKEVDGFQGHWDVGGACVERKVSMMSRSGTGGAAWRWGHGRARCPGGCWDMLSVRIGLVGCAGKVSRRQGGAGVRLALKRHEGEVSEEGVREVVRVDEISQDRGDGV